MVIGRHRFQSVFKPHENKKPKFSNSSGLESVFKEHRFLDGLVWTADLTVEIKVRFKISRRGRCTGYPSRILCQCCQIN